MIFYRWSLGAILFEVRALVCPCGHRYCQVTRTGERGPPCPECV